MWPRKKRGKRERERKSNMRMTWQPLIFMKILTKKIVSSMQWVIWIGFKNNLVLKTKEKTCLIPFMLCGGDGLWFFTHFICEKRLISGCQQSARGGRGQSTLFNFMVFKKKIATRRRDDDMAWLASFSKKKKKKMVTADDSPIKYCDWRGGNFPV